MIEAQVARINEIIDYLNNNRDDEDMMLEMSMNLGIDPETISQVTMEQSIAALHFINEMTRNGKEPLYVSLPTAVGSIWMSAFYIGYVMGTGRSAKEVMES